MNLKDHPLIFAISGSILLMVIFYFAFHEPLQKDILKMNLETQKIVKDGIEILNFKSKHGDLNEYIKKLDERYQDTNIFLPEKIEQGEFINDLQQKALENQVKIVAIIPSKIQPFIEENSDDQKENSDLMKDIVMLPINLKIDCGYIQLLNFLKAIETNERIMQIKNFSIVSKGDGENLSCELNIIIFALEKNNE
ncbi:MAG: type 4a pilus biogenesis protein PilO [Selenomonadaceae bacterium]|nr:type 4a pilus biogenesis protein PilO [Selenomonadaceae bacterium]